RRDAIWQLEQLGEPGFFGLSEFFNPYPSFCSTDDATDRYQQNIPQPMSLRSFDTWVLHLGKNLFQRLHFFHPLISWLLACILSPPSKFRCDCPDCSPCIVDGRIQIC